MNSSPKKWTTGTDQRIRDLHSLGYGATYISRELGLVRDTTRERMRKLGLAPNSNATSPAVRHRNRIRKARIFPGDIDLGRLAELFEKDVGECIICKEPTRFTRCLECDNMRRRNWRASV